MRHAIHVCLISAQATPNLTPALDPNFRPDEIIMLVSPDMAQRADDFSSVIQPLGIKVTRENINDAWDIHDISDKVLTLLANREGADIALNVTGGTKPMAIAAQEAFRSQNLPVFYVHPEKGEVIHLWPKLPTQQLENRVKLRAYLQAHGYAVTEAQRPEITRERRDMTEQLIGEAGKFGRALRTLNYYAQEATGRLVSSVVKEEHLDSQSFMELIELFSTVKALHWQGRQLEFPDEAARFFVNGGWLEYYLFGIINSLRDRLPIQDVAMGLQVTSHAGVKNELDVAFLAKNRLYLVECKTRVFAPDDVSSGAQALYKLDSLAALGGLNTKGMLVSYQKLRDADEQRSKDLRIKTLVGQQLGQIKNEIQAWVSR